MGRTLKRQACSSCNSKDNLCTFLGHNGQEYTKCMTPGCDMKDNGTTMKNTINAPDEFSNSLMLDDYRGISGEICSYLGFSKIIINNEEVIAYQHDNLDGTSDIKYRWPDKRFTWATPKNKTTSLFALNKCTDFDKPLCITEGNEDAASLWEVGYQACSILSSPVDEQSIVQDLDYINKFPEIWLCIEQDQAGKCSIESLKRLLAHKVLRSVDFRPYKDSNECFSTDRDLFLQKLTNPQEIIPIGIVFGNQLNTEQLWQNPPKAIPTPWKGINESLVGLEYGQLYCLLGGSSIGKSSVLREAVYFWRNKTPELKIANIFLEENQTITPLAYLALAANIPLGKLKRNKDLISIEQRQDLYNSVLNTNHLMFINEDYKRDAVNLIKTIKYLVSVKKYDIIILDHISYIIGRSKVGKHGERRDIDELLYELQDLCRNLNCIIVFACHLVDAKGQDEWDKGKIPGMYNGRGTKALAQVPDGIIAVSRNMTNKYEQDVLKLHVLKNRWDGVLGMTDELVYISSTGRLVPK